MNVAKYYAESSFAVHPDFKSHTGATMTMGQGAIHSMSRKQKLNTRNSTEAELVGCYYAITMWLWTDLFMKAQGFPVESLSYQDNKSTILLGNNGSAMMARDCVLLTCVFSFSQIKWRRVS